MGPSFKLLYFHPVTSLGSTAGAFVVVGLFLASAMEYWSPESSRQTSKMQSVLVLLLVDDA